MHKIACIPTQWHMHIYTHTCIWICACIQKLEYFHYYMHYDCEAFREWFPLSFCVSCNALILVLSPWQLPRRSSEWGFKRIGVFVIRPIFRLKICKIKMYAYANLCIYTLYIPRNLIPRKCELQYLTSCKFFHFLYGRGVMVKEGEKE